MADTIVIMPSFNDGPGVVKTLHGITALVRAHSLAPVTAIVVDDGSDEAIELDSSCWPDLGVEVIRSEVNRGPGAAFRAAFLHLTERLADDDIVVMMEGDGTTPLDHLPEMLARLADGYDVVLGSPYIHGGRFAQTSLSRRLLSELANALTRIVLDLRGIWTLSCFFRVYRGSEIMRLQSTHGPDVMRNDGFEAVVELLMHSASAGVRICEVAIVQDQSERIGRSRMRLVRTILGYGRLFVQHRGRGSSRP